MDRSNHYEAAFEAYLQWNRLCYIAVDEHRRSMLGDTPVKSLDFIVYSEEGARLLVDVKGRRYPSGPEGGRRRVWECWSTLDDISGLERWSEVSGESYRALLVFSYHVLPDEQLAPDVTDLWRWRGRRYLIRAVPADEYRQNMRVRSPKWGTVYLPGAVFRRLARPFHEFLVPGEPALSECPF
jgi:hypothetical protein